MNEDLKPQGVPRKLTWDGAMTIAELVALRQRDQFPDGSPEWRAADTIALQIREIEKTWRQYTEKNPDAGRVAEKETETIDHTGSVEMTKNDDFGQIDIRDAEIARLKAALRTVAARIDDSVAAGWLGDYRGTLAAFLREAIGDPPGAENHSE